MRYRGFHRQITQPVAAVVVMAVYCALPLGPVVAALCHQTFHLTRQQAGPTELTRHHHASGHTHSHSHAPGDEHERHHIAHSYHEAENEHSHSNLVDVLLAAADYYRDELTDPNAATSLHMSWSGHLPTVSRSAVPTQPQRQIHTTALASARSDRLFPPPEPPPRT